MTEELTENDVRDVFLWAVEVVSAWSGGSPRLDKAEASLDRFFDSLRAEGYDEGRRAAEEYERSRWYWSTGTISQGVNGLKEYPVRPPNPYRARS